MRGRIDSLGSDAVIAAQTAEDAAMLEAALEDAGIDAMPEEFQKIVSGKKLYNFSTKEKEIWKTAL